MQKYSCPCCGYYTYNIPVEDACGYICPICFWENDIFICSDNEKSDCNHGITLEQARKNYNEYGACEREMLIYVRQPKEDERRNKY